MDNNGLNVCTMSGNLGYCPAGAGQCRIRRTSRSGRGARKMGCRPSWRVQAAMIVGFAPLGGRAPVVAEVQAPSGIWELSIDGAAGKCRISLRPEPSASGRRQITIPLACLRTFPVLGPVESWNLPDVHHLAFQGRAGQAVLDFAAAAGAYIASGPNGETYRLAALNGAAADNASRHEQGTMPRTSIEMAEEPTAKVQAEAAGRYSVLREGGKDTGCMLTLDGKGKAQAKGKASLAPGCRDQGIIIFDPAAWETANGRLVLIARKGHKAHFDAQTDGSWKKDATEGKTLSL